MVPQVHPVDIDAPVPDVPRPGGAGEERGEQHVVQDDAVGVSPPELTKISLSMKEPVIFFSSMVPLSKDTIILTATIIPVAPEVCPVTVSPTWFGVKNELCQLS